jgi:hypothetical protein
VVHAFAHANKTLFHSSEIDVASSSGRILRHLALDFFCLALGLTSLERSTISTCNEILPEHHQLTNSCALPLASPATSAALPSALPLFTPAASFAAWVADSAIRVSHSSGQMCVDSFPPAPSIPFTSVSETVLSTPLTASFAVSTADLRTGTEVLKRRACLTIA